jgi:protoporphyrinogen oxidase
MGSDANAPQLHRPHRLVNSTTKTVVVVGAGFAGLTAAYTLAKKGHRVVVLEADDAPGGLAGTFAFADGVRLEKFYHHWFNNDAYVPMLVSELGMEGSIVTHPSRTGMYFNGRMWKLSTPLDLLRFRALSFVDRIRLGLLVFRVRQVRDWRTIEHLSIREWLEPLCGRGVYKVVWEPLIQSKFSVFAEAVSAVWMWKKLVLRGSTRNAKGGEELAYFKGGFGRLADALVGAIEAHGGRVLFGTRVTSAEVEGSRVTSLRTTKGTHAGDEFLVTTALPITADIFAGVADDSWIARLRRVRYLGNVCLVLRLNRSLSDTYWLNVNDPGFPFVGVIEHTNFDAPENYNGSHIVFLSRYLAKEDPLWTYSDEAYADYALDHLFRMFPGLDRSAVLEYAVWRAEFAQPVTERNYSTYMPARDTPFTNCSIATMAQVYPEDRGTNYAIRDGRAVAEHIASRLEA